MSYDNKNELETVLPDKSNKTEKADLEFLTTNDKPRRRRFNAEYKAGIVKQAAIIRANHGSIGAFLRAEGLYSSQPNSQGEKRGTARARS